MKSLNILLLFLLDVTLLFSSITIEVPLPQNFKSSLAPIQRQIQLCFRNVGCFPNLLRPNDLSLTIQIVTQKDLTSQEIEKVKKAVQNASQQMIPFSLTLDKDEAKFDMLDYIGEIKGSKMRSKFAQFPGAWVGFCCDFQSPEFKNLIYNIQQELKSLGVSYEKMVCEGYILLGFTRFVKVQEHLQKIINEHKISFPQTLTTTIDSLNIANVHLTRMVSKYGDRIDISKEIIKYSLPQQISELAQLKNELLTLQKILMRLNNLLNP